MENFQEKVPYGLSEEAAKAISDSIELEQYHIAKAELLHLHPADLADFISSINYDYKVKIIQILGRELDPELFLNLDIHVKQKVISILGLPKFAKLINKLELEDELYVIEDLDEEYQQKILPLLPEDKRISIEESLSYPEDSAARLMHKRIVAVPEYWNVGQTIDYLRNHPELPENFHEIFVIDPKHRPIGSIIVSKVVRSQRDVQISTIVKKDIKTIKTDYNKEDIAYLFKQYGLASVPVINKDGRLVGMIVIDDVVDLIDEEAEQDILRMGGIQETDVHTASFYTAKHRFPWLFVNLLTACITSTVITFFEDTIQQLVILAAIMPIVASMGGNAGTQAVTVAVRALSTKELTNLNAFRVIIKEIIASLLNSIALAILGGIIILIWYHNITLSLVFSIAVIINLTLAGFFGITIPLLLNKGGADPAVSSTVILTALTDIIGFFAILSIAKIFLVKLV